MALTIIGATRLDAWRRIINDHCYISDTELITSSGANDVDFSLASVEAGMMDVERYSGPDSATRRTWHHIRQKPRESYLLWFPQNGHVIITQDQERESMIERGDFFVTYGNRPHYARSTSGGGDPCTQLFVWVPAHVMRSTIPEIDDLCGRKFSGGQGPGSIGANLFGQLLDQADHCPPDTLASLGEAALNAVRDAVRVNGQAPHGGSNHRSGSFERVMRYIDQNFTKQGLTAEQVAHDCNLSLRSFHYLMRSMDIGFAAYLRTKRLNQARQWLNDPEFVRFNIVDIAYMSGFPNASYFSNAYRNEFGTTPREMRRSIEGSIMASRNVI
ncbi:AraC family transcriptional regulator [Sphingobium sp. AN558]|uniref:helix-turn-helix transcriptional regulator n=1 Tax=Sphingobium sp. AN558 TaxID=3133442 RepID=UPI0030C0C57F